MHPKAVNVGKRRNETVVTTGRKTESGTSLLVAFPKVKCVVYSSRMRITNKF
jgi:hypothetical protein